jgi:hypothetical protein
MNFVRIRRWLLAGLCVGAAGLWLDQVVQRPFGGTPFPVGRAALQGDAAVPEDASKELAALRQQLAERDEEIAKLRGALGAGRELSAQPVFLGAAEGLSSPGGLPGSTPSAPSFQVGRFQAEQRDGNLLFKDEKGRPAFVFDAERRSIVAPNGVYIAAEGRLVMADTPPAEVKSEQGNQPVKVGFKNETASRLDLAWVNYEGKLVYYKTLQPGESFQQKTFETHPWVALNAAGKILDVIHPTRQDENEEFIFAPIGTGGTPGGRNPSPAQPGGSP